MCRLAYEWIKNKPSVTEFERRDDFLVYLAANDQINKPLSREEIIEIKTSKYVTFDEYKNNYDTIIVMKFCNVKSRWNIDSTCTCVSFQKKFICKHLIGLAFYNKLKKCPEEGSGLEIAPKKKKGRIARARKALQKQ